MTKTKIAILSISILTILLNGAIGQIYSILSEQLPGATPEALKFTLSDLVHFLRHFQPADRVS